MLKYIRNFLVAFLIPVVISLAFTSQAFAAQVDINSADAATLAQSVNGIGPSKAQAIIDYRDANGPFESLDELVNVQGIGLKTLDRIREFIKVAPGSRPSSASKSLSATSDSASVVPQPALQPN